MLPESGSVSKDEIINVDAHVEEQPVHWKRSLALKSLVLLIVFGIGIGGGFLMGRMSMEPKIASNASATEAVSEVNQEGEMSMMDQINPPGGYKIPAVFGDVGVQLVAAGAIDMAKFTKLYQQQNQPLTNEQMDVLTKETGMSVVINPQNAYFLLNFFWALGLANENPVLSDGPIMSGGRDKVGGYASTGGWTLGAKQATELFASRNIVTLTNEQQTLLDEVTAGVYRPCCDNPTHFPDCNHGMAMLGLLELMASQNATAEQMYEAAKYVNAFWYPQQMLEVATLFKVTQKVDYAKADARQVVSGQYSSGSGFQSVHQWLSQNGKLEQAPSSGGSCGVK